MANDKNFNQAVLHRLQKLCADCDKSPSLLEGKMQSLKKPESLEKWWPKNEKHYPSHK
jgi:hypothetical protein